MSPCNKFFVFAFALFTPTLSMDTIDCGTQVSYKVKVDNGTLLVHDAKINIKYERDSVAVYQHRDTEAVNILINDTLVTFNGHFLYQTNKFHDNRKIVKSLNSQIAGSARAMITTSNEFILKDCDFYFSRKIKDDSENLPANLQIEFLHRASRCAKTSLCLHLGNVSSFDLKNAKDHPYDFGPLAVGSKNTSDTINKSNTSEYERIKQNVNIANVTSLMNSIGEIESNNFDKTEQNRSIINMLVDLTIAEIAKKIKEENNGYVNISDIKETFFQKSLLRPRGEFEATGGTFWDLSTLKKIDDAVLSHKGLKFVVSCGIGISKDFVHYDKYKVKYLFSFGGDFSAEIDGIEFRVEVAIDCNHRPCKIFLQEFKITKFGKMKVKLTGLWPFNTFISKIVTWITKTLKDRIIIIVEQEVRKIIDKYLSIFNYEKYSP